MNVEHYKLPAYWCGYLINGDPSGLQDGEQAVIDAFCKGLDCLGWEEGEAYFSWYNDATDLGVNVLDYTFQRITK